MTKEVRVASPAIVEAKPVKTIKDKVRAMRELLLSDEYAEQKRAVNRFMLLLSTLYSLDARAFAEATESLHGRTRVYFAADEQTLLKMVIRPSRNMCRHAVLGDHQHQHRP